jgi:hypothetical protein
VQTTSRGGDAVVSNGFAIVNHKQINIRQHSGSSRIPTTTPLASYPGAASSLAAARPCAEAITSGCRYSPPGNVSGQFSRNVPKAVRVGEMIHMNWE